MCEPSEPHTDTEWSTKRTYSFNFLGPIAKSNERLEVMTKVLPPIFRMVFQYKEKVFGTSSSGIEQGDFLPVY